MRHRLLTLVVRILCLAVVAIPATLPAQTLPATQARKPLTLSQQRRLAALTQQSIDLIRAQKLTEARAVLETAIKLDPTVAVNLYNLACVCSIQGEKELAIGYLERAAENGFVDFAFIQRDEDLVALRSLPRYKRLIGAKDEYQRIDAERALKALKGQFGDSYLYEIDPQSKLLFATNTDEKTLKALKANLLAQAGALRTQLFTHRPDSYIRVVLPSPEDYRKIVKMPGVGGFYNHEMKQLISRTMGQIMTHEFTHALHAADQQAQGQEHPIWIIEGLAVLYEASRVENGAMVPQDNFRLPFLQDAQRRGRLLPLSKILLMDQKEFMQNATLAYGESGSLLQYLSEKKLLGTFYQAYTRGYAADATGRKALEAVTGMPLNKLETAWRQWMAQRKVDAFKRTANSPFIGIRFSQAPDGLLVEDVIADGPGEKAGMETGDILIGIGTVDVRDQQTLGPTLAKYKPGQTVTLRIRRQQQYKDIKVLLERLGDQG